VSSDPGPTPTPAATPARRRRWPLLAAGAGLLLVALAGAAWVVLPRRVPAGPGGAPPSAPTPTATVSVGGIVVNLADPGQRRYLKVAVDLGVATARDAKVVEEHKAQILDLVITVFSSKPAEALASAEGRAQVKDELLRRLRTELGLAAVRRVYFTEFLIQ
jgi:flagellar FliL protein